MLNLSPKVLLNLSLKVLLNLSLKVLLNLSPKVLLNLSLKVLLNLSLKVMVNLSSMLNLNFDTYVPEKYIACEKSHILSSENSNLETVWKCWMLILLGNVFRRHVGQTSVLGDSEYCKITCCFASFNSATNCFFSAKSSSYSIA